jgi:DNA-binding response OmpR family regulator
VGLPNQFFAGPHGFFSGISAQELKGYFMARLLLVEDDESLQQSLTDYLKREGYQVELAPDLKAAEEKCRDQMDLVILDWMLPDGQGIDLLTGIRKNGQQIPVIFLTARSELIDKVLALEMGANDYLTKPFEPRELLARVRAQLRTQAAIIDSPVVSEKKTADESQQIEVGALRIDKMRHEVTFNGRKTDLVKKEYDLLVLLAENPERVFSREEILNKVWGYEVYPTTRTVDTHVMLIRQKICENLIETVRSIGYRLKII